MVPNPGHTGSSLNPHGRQQGGSSGAGHTHLTPSLPQRGLRPPPGARGAPRAQGRAAARPRAGWRQGLWPGQAAGTGRRRENSQGWDSERQLLSGRSPPGALGGRDAAPSPLAPRAGGAVRRTPLTWQLLCSQGWSCDPEGPRPSRSPASPRLPETPEPEARPPGSSGPSPGPAGSAPAESSRVNSRV